MEQLILHPAKKTAVAVRREMVRIPAVMGALAPVERAVFLASTDRTIAEYSGEALSAELAKTLKWIAKDVGYKPTDESERQYLIIRTAEILKRYYSNLTIKDFRMAFEMSLTGELDDFLPRGRDGQPDKNHYQQFNAEYICKILNAYKGRRAWVLKKAHDAAPKAEQARDLESERYYHNKVREDCVNAFLYYKYKGRMPEISLIGEMLYYQALSNVGLADEIAVTPAEQKAVLERMIAGFGRKDKKARNGSFQLARRDALEHTFAWMVKHEIQITDYIKFE